MAGRVQRAWALRVAAGSYRFRESLFLLPALIMAGGTVLAVLASAADRALGAHTTLPGALEMSSNAATWLLSTVAGAMVTTVGVVLSLTIVSLQLASSQFSPRVMRSFIRDRLSQVVIGLLVATFVYCVLTLPHISGEATASAPRVSLTLAVVLTLVTVVAIIAHLDHLARRLQVGHVVRDIAAEGRAVIARMRTSPERYEPLTATEAQTSPPAHAAQVLCDLGGWVSQVSVARLLAAVPPGTTVRLETRVGAYIHAGETLVSVWPAPSGKARERLAGAIMVSTSRTMQQDVDFAIRQLVDIGLRALSAAINDPTTAVEVTLRVGGLLRELLTIDQLAPAARDGQARVLVRPWDLNHGEYIAHAFDQLRHAAPPQPQVAAALLRVLRMLIRHVAETGHGEHVPALRRQIHLLLASLEVDPSLHPQDLARLRRITADETDPADHSIAGGLDGSTSFSSDR